MVKYSPLPPSAHPALAEPRLQTAPTGPPMDHSQPTNPAKWNTCQNLTESFILEPRPAIGPQNIYKLTFPKSYKVAIKDIFSCQQKLQYFGNVK